MRRIVRLAVSLALAAAPALGQDKLGLIELTGSPRERPGDLAWLLGSTDPTLREITSAIEDAASDDKIGTVVIRLKDAELNRTQVEEIGAAIKAAREAGKKVAVYAENYGPPELLLASYATKAIIQTGGEVSLPGLHMEEMYLADTLAWLGVKADMVQIGDYKGADEMFVNAAPSKPWDQNITQLLDSLYGVMRAHLESGRHMSEEQLDKAMQAAWMADADEAVKVGLLDEADDLPALGKALTGKDDPEWVELDVGAEPATKMDSMNPFTALSELAKLITSKPDHTPKGPTIAVLHIDGTIIDGDSSEGGLLGGEGSVGSRTIRNSLEDIRDQADVKGMVVRIDSPGGSAVASEVMWQGIRRVAEKKPVWVSVGSMAASGGYYTAVAGDKIYVSPSSIVGSIGVVGGKMALGGLYDKLKIRVVERGRGPMADLESSVSPWTPDQLNQVRAKMTRTFELFKKRVAMGRKDIDLSKTAGGWLFCGQKAIDMKMADEIGGLDDCIADLADTLKIKDYDVMDYPGPKGIHEILEDLFKGGVASRRVQSGGIAADLLATLEQVVGPKAWPNVRASLGSMLLLRDHPVILAMPRALIIK
jgi:protease-4